MGEYWLFDEKEDLEDWYEVSKIPIVFNEDLENKDTILPYSEEVNDILNVLDKELERIDDMLSIYYDALIDNWSMFHREVNE